MLLSRDRENNTLVSENQMLKTRLEEFRGDSTQLKEEQGRLIENLRIQLNETRERLTEVKDEKHREFKKLKERHDDPRRREADQFTFEHDKLRSEVAISQKRLG